MKKAILAVCLLSGVCFAHWYGQMELLNWTTCVKPNCDPGGLTTVETTLNQHVPMFGESNALEFSVTGGAYSNALFWDKVGPTDANIFISGYDVYLPQPTADTYQNLEYDTFAFNTPYRYMFGTQCARGGKWQVWDDLHVHWLDTTTPCNLGAGKHHIEEHFHRDPSNPTACSGYPCMYYDRIIVDGIGFTPIMADGTPSVQPAGPMSPSWTDNSGLNIQLDNGKYGGSLIEYVGHAHLSER